MHCLSVQASQICKLCRWRSCSLQVFKTGGLAGQATSGCGQSKESVVKIGDQKMRWGREGECLFLDQFNGGSLRLGNHSTQFKFL